MWRRLASFSLFVGVLIGVWQFQALADWWYFKNYQPTSQISELAHRAYLSPEGQRLFYRANPELHEKRDFNTHCPIIEESFVLGCYSGRRIYLLKVTRPELAGVMEVTAAHEMLHAAYERLDDATREKIDNQLEQFYATVKNRDLRNLISVYAKAEPFARLNEMHSILPTQLANLSPELEDYYARYFTDRSKVAKLFSKYEAVFTDLESKISKLQVRLAATRSDLELLERDIDLQRQELEETNRLMNGYRGSNNIQAYNQLVPAQNAQVNEYNSLVEEYKGLVARHNQLVEQINRLALEQSSLADSLDSTKYEKL